jgi:hypothetical protein
MLEDEEKEIRNPHPEKRRVRHPKTFGSESDGHPPGYAMGAKVGADALI